MAVARNVRTGSSDTRSDRNTDKLTICPVVPGGWRSQLVNNRHCPLPMCEELCSVLRSIKCDAQSREEEMKVSGRLRKVSPAKAQAGDQVKGEESAIGDTSAWPHKTFQVT